jgi:hypothetical protein
MTRICCCVPFCKRTVDPEKGFGEWLCQKHWMTVDKRQRRLLQGRHRQERNARAAMFDARVRARWHWQHHGKPDAALWRELVVTCEGYMAARERTLRAWERCKRQAIERAAGLT